MPTHHNLRLANVTHTVTRKTLPLLANYDVWVAGAHQIEVRQLEGRNVRVVIADWKHDRRANCWPASERSLSKEFSQVTDERSLLEFSNRYGLLGFHKLHKAEMLGRDETWEGDPCDWALAHARIASGIYGAIDLFNDVRNRKLKLDDRTTASLLRTLFREFEKMGLSANRPRKTRVLPFFEWRHPEMKVSENSPPLRWGFISRWSKDPIGTAYRVLSWVLNHYIRRIHFEFESSDYAQRVFGMPSEGPRFGLELRWDALIEVIYWQLGERIGGSFRACRRCGRTFPMPTGKTLYCSRECGDALRSQRYRDNKKKKRRTLRKARVPRTRKANAVSSRRAR
ncbi:MAG: hypothetical protein WBF09_08900 [Candidatus Acidiferrum sp.]